MKKIFFLLFTAIIISGCQTTAREKLPIKMYHEFARIGVGLKHCTLNNSFNEEYAAKSVLAVDEALKTWSYDKPTLKSEIVYIESVVKKEGFPFQACSGIKKELDRIIKRHPQTLKDNTHLDNLEHQMIWGTPKQWQDIQKQSSEIYNLGNEALESTKTKVPEVVNPEINKNKNMLDYRPNTGINNLNTHQTLKSTKKSSSGKLVCHYSAGTVKIMPLGTVSCPKNIN